MLGRSTLQACRANARAKAGSLTAVRTNTTAPAKRRIPLANAFADLAIPEQAAIAGQNRRNPFALTADFAGRGSLSSHLMAKRAQDVARNSQQKQAQPGTEESVAYDLAVPPQLAAQRAREPRPQRTPRAPRTANRKTARAPRTNTRAAAKAAEEELEDEEPTPEELEQMKAAQEADGGYAVMVPTDLSSLFAAPTPAPQQVVPFAAEVKATAPAVSLKGPRAARAFQRVKQRALVRAAGTYDAYLPAQLARSPRTNAVEKMGPVRYGRLALCRVYNAPLRQRQNAVAVMSRLTQPARPATATAAA